MKKIQAHINSILTQIQEDGLFKNERIITSEQQSKIDICKTQILEFVNEKKIQVVDR